MARIRVLNALKIKQNLKPGMYADGLGLYLKVRDGGSRSWIFRYRTDGKLRDMGLGPAHTVSLAEAREKAEVCRALRLKGLDPLEERHKELQAKTIATSEAITFEKCAEAYIAAHKAGWKNGKHADQWTATLQTAARKARGCPIRSRRSGCCWRSDSTHVPRRGVKDNRSH